MKTETHFRELQKRVYISITSFMITFIVFFIFSDNIYTITAYPLLKMLPYNGSLIATKITSTFLVPIKLSFILAIIINMPFFLYNAWIFISPGLYKQEKKFLTTFVCISSLLFFLGIMFSFCILCPAALKFFIHCAPKGVAVMTDINSYFEFIITLSISCGLIFQIPIFIIGLTRLNILKKQELLKKRSYIIVISLIFGMLLTPPDVVSQILLAIPIYCLFELGILLSK